MTDKERLDAEARRFNLEAARLQREGATPIGAGIINPRRSSGVVGVRRLAPKIRER